MSNTFTVSVDAIKIEIEKLQDEAIRFKAESEVWKNIQTRLSHRMPVDGEVVSRRWAFRLNTGDYSVYHYHDDGIYTAVLTANVGEREETITIKDSQAVTATRLYAEVSMRRNKAFIASLDAHTKAIKLTIELNHLMRQ